MLVHSITDWKFAKRPNYVTNVDKKYPYSEVPYIGNYHLVRIPDQNLLDHVDYWGEGRIEAPEGTSGFIDCYNVNHEYQLVSNGPDRDRKIPNRIPVISYTNCNTSSYINDNSVKLVTLMGAPINTSCAEDIARMINSDEGRVVVLGFNEKAADIKNLEKELFDKNLLYCFGYELQDNLKGLTLYDNHRAYLNLTQLKEQLVNNITSNEYVNAVNITKTLENNDKGNMIKEVVSNILKKGKLCLTAYAYQLWNNDAKDIVTKHFPIAFKIILNGDSVKIINKKNMFALKVDDAENKFEAMGDSKDKTSKKVQWKFTPIWDSNYNNVYFKILNVEHDMLLKLDAEEGNENKVAIGEKTADNKTEQKFQWSLDPVKVDDDILFFIINREQKQGLKLDDKVNPSGDQQVVGNVGPIEGNPSDFGWFIAPFESY